MLYFEDKLRIALLVIMVLVVALIFKGNHLNNNEYKCTVIEKTVKRSKETDKYLIFTKDENGKTRTFENTDTFSRGKFNSSDVYAELKVGQRYKFKVYGFRVGFLSWYENIYDYTKIK